MYSFRLLHKIFVRDFIIRTRISFRLLCASENFLQKKIKLFAVIKKNRNYKKIIKEQEYYSTDLASRVINNENHIFDDFIDKIKEEDKLTYLSFSFAKFDKNVIIASYEMMKCILRFLQFIKSQK